MGLQTITLTVGIPASGKDTWAAKQPAVVINRDDIRKLVFTETGSIHDYKFTKHKEQQVTEVQLRAASIHLKRGSNVIVSDTNLNPKTRQVWEDYAKKNCVPLGYMVIDTPLHTCIKRNAKRADHVPESVIIRMETKMRDYLGKYTHDPRNPNGLIECVIFDIDGTLADMKGVRGPFEWGKVGLDKTRNFVCDHLTSIECSRRIFIFSGRDGVCRQETRAWLKRAGITHDGLYMREEGSRVNDTIVKEEMFDNHIKDKYHVSHIVDDRKSVCQMWESMGFNVMNVGGFLADF
jgi:predicted kinase